MEPLRSLLFIPGNRERFLEKAPEVGADALVPDLESGVPESEKAAARDMIRDALPVLKSKGQTVLARVSSIDSSHLYADLNSLISEHLDGVVLPQISSADDIRRLDEMITSLEQGKHLPFGLTRIIPFVESALGVIRSFEIATASSRVAAIAFGAEDFSADMGIPRSQGSEEILYARSHVAIAARAAHKLAIDAPFVAYQDAEGIEADAEQALRLGFKGKFAIHPDQVATLNEIFSPSEEDLEQARRIIRAFQRAESEGRGTCVVDGKMIDTAMALQAQKLIRTAQGLAGR